MGETFALLSLCLATGEIIGTIRVRKALKTGPNEINPLGNIVLSVMVGLPALFQIAGSGGGSCLSDNRNGYVDRARQYLENGALISLT